MSFLSFLAFLGIIFSFSSLASLPPKIKNMACNKQVNIKLRELGSQNIWTQTASPTTGVYSFRTPGKNFANWIFIQNFPKEIKTFLLSPKETRVYKWDVASCDMIFSEVQKPLILVKNKKVKKFSDKDLEPRVKDLGQFSMIYIWDPGMIYSAKEMHVFETVAKEYGMNFIPILGVNADLKFAKKTIKRFKLKVPLIKNNSIDLNSRDSENHYPTTFIVGNNNVSQKIFGAYPPKNLKVKIDEQLMIIKRDTYEK
jgi:hypothetical protein